ncbi:hypothetical protein F4804DRAFT_312787 [Jackrogersella minutella]|nr:hypothetical protein F4804DRAFT_312787 [Jackrogersella minutella]
MENSSKAMDGKLDLESFGPLANILEGSLVQLASTIRERVLQASTCNGELIARIVGAYNLVHSIQLDGLKLVIRIPITGWGSGKTDTAVRALESQVATMRVIARRTSIPVPEVYDFDSTDENVIGAPYICMSFVSGTPVSQVWFKEPDTRPREEMRHSILRSFSQVMTQFQCFTFDKLVSISGEKTSNPLAPCYDWHETDDDTVQIVSSGPFDSTSNYLAIHYKESRRNEWGIAESKILL